MKAGQQAKSGVHQAGSPKKKKQQANKNGLKKPKTAAYEEQSIFFGSPVFIMIMCPMTITMLWIFCTQPIDTSILALPKLTHCISTWEQGGAQELQAGFYSLGRDIWRFLPLPTGKAILIVLIFAVFEGILLRFVPGKRIAGPVAPSGDTTHYTLNGIPCFLLTHLAFFVFAAPFSPVQLFSASIIYDNFGAIIMALTLYVKAYCFILYWKGRYFPSGRDNKVSINFYEL